jgi:hypothetical protein
MSKITWNDMHSATFKELKKTYKMTDRQIEIGVRKHLDGASTTERNKMYETVYSNKGKE